MTSHVTSLLGAKSTPRHIFTDTFRRQILQIDAGSHQCRIPRLHGLYERRPRMHYHFKPELFIQLSGVTDFSFPDERFTLQPGEICIVPKGLPHGEVARDSAGRFENVVVSFYHEVIEVHLAHEAGTGFPRADQVCHFTTELYLDLIGYLDRITVLHDRDPRRNGPAIRGLLLAEFALLQTTVESPMTHPPATADPVALCRWLVQHNLQEDALSVDWLAREIGCSANHLSKLFHRRTGERLVEYINRLRIQTALEALRLPQFSVKAVATACGFHDASYFSRVFRQATGRSPHEFRDALRRQAQLGTLRPPDAAPSREADESVTVESRRRGCGFPRATLSA